MNTRPFVAGLFVALCLLLCGLILRRQIAGHPLPPDISQAQEFHPAGAVVSQQAQAAIRGQVEALNARDGRRAFFYQSREMRHHFSSPGEFLKMINARYPEFGQSRAVYYGPVWADKNGSRAQARVLVEGKNGRQVRGVFQLVREGGELKVGGFLPVGGFAEGGPAQRER